MFPYVDFTWSRFTARTMLDAPSQVHQEPRVSTNVDFFPCPASDAFQDLHAWRDVGLMQVKEVSGVFYDISSGNPMLWSRCWRTEHGHTPGRGREIIEAYDLQNRKSKRDAQNETSRYLVQGVETIIENIIGSIDFYVSRAGAGPLGVLESWLPQPEAPPGHGREIVPLFESVYHDIGPVREDGWLTLDKEIGDLFYWAAARIVLQWGAILSLHYGNNPPEKLPDSYEQKVAELVDWDGSTLRFDNLTDLDLDKAAFVSELARARTVLANPYLAYGRLLRPVPPDNATCDVDYRRRVHMAPRLDIAGSWVVPQIVHGAWLSPGGNVGLLYVNIADAPMTTNIHQNLTGMWSTNPTGWNVWIVKGGESHEVGTVGADGVLSLELTLPGRQVVLVELREVKETEEEE